MRLEHICVGGDDTDPGSWGATYWKCRLGSYSRPTGLGALGWGWTWNLHFKPLGGLQAQPSLRTVFLEEQMAKPCPTQRRDCSVTLPQPGPFTSKMSGRHLSVKSYTIWYIHGMEYWSARKKKWQNDIDSKMDETQNMLNERRHTGPCII